jgi:hypothetical protein
LWVLLLPDYGRLALWGGGFTVLPEGLEFRFAWHRIVFPWPELDRVGAEPIDFGYAITDPVVARCLVIRFNTGAHSWPRSMTLAKSGRDRLVVSASILSGSLDSVAAGINDARIAATDGVDEELARWRPAALA